MESLTVYIRDKKKYSFLYQILKHFDFVIMPKSITDPKRKKYDFFKSSGIWKDREITQQVLRAKAWKKE